MGASDRAPAPSLLIRLTPDSTQSPLLKNLLQGPGHRVGADSFEAGTISQIEPEPESSEPPATGTKQPAPV